MFNILRTQLPGQMITSFWHQEIAFATVNISDDDFRFCDSTAMLQMAKLCINSMVIALLILCGFVPLKTWLLLACHTEFYAII